MSYSRDGRSSSPPYSRSPVRARRSRSLSKSRGRSRSRSRDSGDAVNPGNNLYVTGLSTRVTATELEKFLAVKGRLSATISQILKGEEWDVPVATSPELQEIWRQQLDQLPRPDPSRNDQTIWVLECHLVTDPRTKESRGFGFVTMETSEDADRCIKYLNRSVLEGRMVTVEKAKRKRGRTPTPGKYFGLKDRRGHGRRRSRSYSPRRWLERDPYPRDRRGRSRSPYGRRRDEYSDLHRRRRDHSPSYDGSHRSD